jgi:hypothetical protein
MRGICDFLNEPWDAAVLSIQPDSPDARWAARFKSRRTAGAKCVVTDNSGKWRTEMSLRDRALFESVAGSLTAELGYPVEGLARTLSSGERLLWEMHHRVRHLARTLERLSRPRGRRTVVSFGWAAARSILRRPGSSD